MNKQQLESIINNAPEIEGVVFDGRYFKYADGIWLVYTGGCPDYEECAFHDSPMPDASRVRKLSDLQTQLNQLSEIERLKSAEKRAFWWSAEFTHVAHDGKIQQAWEDYKELNK